MQKWEKNEAGRRSMLAMWQERISSKSLHKYIAAGGGLCDEPEKIHGAMSRVKFHKGKNKEDW